MRLGSSLPSQSSWRKRRYPQAASAPSRTSAISAGRSAGSFCRSASRLATIAPLLRRLFGVPVHDNSCTLRAYRGEVARSLDLAFDDLSFIPVMLHLRGLTVVERFARHHPRLAGTAKYDSPRRFVYTLRKMIRLWREKRTIQRPKSELD